MQLAFAASFDFRSVECGTAQVIADLWHGHIWGTPASLGVPLLGLTRVDELARAFSDELERGLGQKAHRQ